MWQSYIRPSCLGRGRGANFNGWEGLALPSSPLSSSLPPPDPRSTRTLRLDESSWVLAWRLPSPSLPRLYPTPCYKEIWVSPKIRDFVPNSGLRNYFATASRSHFQQISSSSQILFTQPFLFLLQDSLYGFPILFTVTSEHIRLFTF